MDTNKRTFTPATCEPAHSVIRNLKGVRATARLLGVTPATVTRWQSPPERGGTGGFIPRKYWRVILNTANTGKYGFSVSLERLAGIDVENNGAALY